MARTEVRGGQILDASVDLTADVTGTLPINKGGTGTASLPTGILEGAGTGAITAAAAGTDYVAPGGALGTPSSGTLTNCTGLPPAGLTLNPGMVSPVRVQTIGTETFTIASGTVTQINGTTIASVSVSVGDRILIGNAPASTGTGNAFGWSSQPGNGVYDVTGNTTNITVSRSADWSGSIHPAGRKVTIVAGTGWLTTPFEATVSVPTSFAAFTWGTTALTLAPSGGMAPTFNGLITAGTGLQSNYHVQAMSTNTYDLGTSSLLWRHTYSTDIELGHASDTTLSRSSAGLLAVEGVVVDTISAANTLTNKRITPRIGTTASSATPSIDCGLYDQYNITALAANITSVTVTGTPTDGQKLLVRITGTATRTIAWGSSFLSSGDATLLATTSGTLTHMVGFIYDSVKAKWVCQAVDPTGY